MTKRNTMKTIETNESRERSDKRFTSVCQSIALVILAVPLCIAWALAAIADRK